MQPCNTKLKWTRFHCHPLSSEETISSCVNRSCRPLRSLNGSSDLSKVHIFPQPGWAFMYVDTITHAPLHVWLCDNARPVWQAPCIIALGRELHNNVVQSNACGFGAITQVLLPFACSQSWGTDKAHFSTCEAVKINAEVQTRFCQPHGGGVHLFSDCREAAIADGASWSTLRAWTNPPPKQMITWSQSATKPTQTKTRKKNGLTDSKCLFT